jgi:hypothetical protein
MNGLKLDLGSENDGKGGGGLTFEENAPRIIFRAKKTHEVQVEMTSEALKENRSLLHYLALPAEQYSVLDAGTIMKKSDMDADGNGNSSNPNAKANEFTCAVDAIHFLGSTLEATIDAVVDVSEYPRGKSVIRVVNCTLQGSRLATLANGRFDVDCTNVVRALPSVVVSGTGSTGGNSNIISGDMGPGGEADRIAEKPKARSKSRLGRLRDNIIQSTTNANNNNNIKDDNHSDEQQRQRQQETDSQVDMLSVECQLEISALVPLEGKWLPKRLVGKSGSVVMQSLLSVLVPRFVDQLAADYQKWSSGDDSRSPVSVSSTSTSMAKASEDDDNSNTNTNDDDETPSTNTKEAPPSSLTPMIVK